MNIVVTSREQLLKAAKEIAECEGISKINIRSVADKCGISVGSIYNYFPTKADLVVSVIEDFWLGVFKNLKLEGLDRMPFLKCFELVFNELSYYLQDFEKSWIEQLSVLETSEKQIGRNKEKEYFAKIKAIFIKSLVYDESIPKSLWNTEFTREEFADFVLDNTLSILKKKQSCTYFIHILYNILY